jgi:hypothetical protein
MHHQMSAEVDTFNTIAAEIVQGPSFFPKEDRGPMLALLPFFHHNDSRQRRAGHHHHNDKNHHLSRTDDDNINMVLVPQVLALKRDTLPKGSKTLLPGRFKPSTNSVVIGKGIGPKQVTGSQRLQSLVKAQLENYSKSKSGEGKSFIASTIFHEAQQSCPEGGAFLSFDGQRWCEAGETMAREKTNHSSFETLFTINTSRELDATSPRGGYARQSSALTSRCLITSR